MVLLNFDPLGIGIILSLLAWIIPIVMLHKGLTNLKSRPKYAKRLIIIAGVWLTIGIGVCGSMFT